MTCHLVFPDQTTNGRRRRFEVSTFPVVQKRFHNRQEAGGVVGVQPVTGIFDGDKTSSREQRADGGPVRNCF